MTLSRSVSALRGATLGDGTTADIHIANGTITAITPAAATPVLPGELDCNGHVVTATTVEPHAHLDKAGSFDAIRPPMGDLASAIAAWRSYTVTMTEEDVRSRARAQVLRQLANGTTAIRSHVDILLGEDPLLGVRALTAVRDELAPMVDIELVALAGHDVPDEHIYAALDAGVDLVGGASHLAPDPVADLRRLLAIAAARGIGADLHTDESLHGPITLAALIAATRDWTVNVSAGHCVRLGTLPAAHQDELIEGLRTADIGIIANPITNLYLQGWDDVDQVAMPRGLAPAKRLIDAGVRFAGGADNVMDPFNPLGRSDALETAMLLVTASHLTAAEAMHAVTDGARDVLRLPTAGACVGADADLLIIPGTSLVDIIANAPADRTVLRHGVVVATRTTSTELASPSIPALSSPITESR